MIVLNRSRLPIICALSILLLIDIVTHSAHILIPKLYEKIQNVAISVKIVIYSFIVAICSIICWFEYDEHYACYCLVSYGIATIVSELSKIKWLTN